MFDFNIGPESRSSSINKKKDFNSLFAYDSTKNEYEKNSEIDHLPNEVKEYIERTLNTFNQELKKTTSHVPCGFILCQILVYALSVLILICIGYIGILFCALCLFNPMIVIAFLFFGLTKGLAIMYYIHFKVKERIKAKKINNLIDLENTTKKSSSLNGITWGYGRDGSWIEVKIENK